VNTDPIKFPRTMTSLAQSLCENVDTVVIDEAERSMGRRSIAAAAGLVVFAVVVMGMLAWWVPLVYLAMIGLSLLWIDWPLRKYWRGEAARAENRVRLLESAKRMDYGSRHGWHREPPEAS
jgi:uncharacterized membrane protein